MKNGEGQAVSLEVRQAGREVFRGAVIQMLESKRKDDHYPAANAIRASSPGA